MDWPKLVLAKIGLAKNGLAKNGLDWQKLVLAKIETTMTKNGSVKTGLAKVGPFREELGFFVFLSFLWFSGFFVQGIVGFVGEKVG